ncbi:MAG: 50S ribosomal protein L3 [Deltaproteobacteria bacterium]|jgi:large subunit ribosomal protein L3|nr:50S ribosomal protein L3 [Deltaproteobacteria bacterium]PNV87143.1 MAG: 50S ribosomal protein L3 [Desulfobacteraceae bacterium]MDH3801882.1 50S ribosomal protein L3 [Deltaproteobacteria bacterium]MDH3851918.1 50S ribosomal protein L3 [Deltaproteobacteria bacterium]MDH3896727.1 50S ribosomal protein L3 [Deltaproteobacteria bacterium]
MVNALIGKKLGMSQLFSPDGEVTPVTVIQVGPCTVTQIKSVASDGYNAVQLGFGEKKPQRTKKPLLGHFKKSGKGPFAVVREVRVDDVGEFELGQEVNADIFQVGELVHVVGKSKGKGFAGTIKRWNFSRGPMSHGGMNKRAPGSIGCSATPARVIKGRKMPGQMGNRRATVKGLMVVDVRPEENIILIRGAVPGGRNGVVFIKKSGKF